MSAEKWTDREVALLAGLLNERVARAELQAKIQRGSDEVPATRSGQDPDETYSEGYDLGHANGYALGLRSAINVIEGRL